MGVTNTSLHFLPHFLPSAYSNPLHQNTAGASGKLQPTSAPRLKTEIIRELTGIYLLFESASGWTWGLLGAVFFRQTNLQRLHFFCKRTQLLVILAAPGNLSNVHPEWKEQCRIFHPSPPLLFSSPCTNYSVSRCQQRYIHHPPTWSRFWRWKQISTWNILHLQYLPRSERR